MYMPPIESWKQSSLESSAWSMQGYCASTVCGSFSAMEDTSGSDIEEVSPGYLPSFSGSYDDHRLISSCSSLGSSTVDLHTPSTSYLPLTYSMDPYEPNNTHGTHQISSVSTLNAAGIHSKKRGNVKTMAQHRMRWTPIMLMMFDCAVRHFEKSSYELKPCKILQFMHLLFPHMKLKTEEDISNMAYLSRFHIGSKLQKFRQKRRHQQMDHMPANSEETSSSLRYDYGRSSIHNEALHTPPPPVPVNYCLASPSMLPSESYEALYAGGVNTSISSQLRQQILPHSPIVKSYFTPEGFQDQKQPLNMRSSIDETIVDILKPVGGLDLSLSNREKSNILNDVARKLSRLAETLGTQEDADYPPSIQLMLAHRNCLPSNFFTIHNDIKEPLYYPPEEIFH